MYCRHPDLHPSDVLKYVRIFGLLSWHLRLFVLLSFWLVAQICPILKGRQGEHPPWTLVFFSSYLFNTFLSLLEFPTVAIHLTLTHSFRLTTAWLAKVIHGLLVESPMATFPCRIGPLGGMGLCGPLPPRWILQCVARTLLFCVFSSRALGVLAWHGQPKWLSWALLSTLSLPFPLWSLLLLSDRHFKADLHHLVASRKKN